MREAYPQKTSQTYKLLLGNIILLLGNIILYSVLFYFLPISSATWGELAIRWAATTLT